MSEEERTVVEWIAYDEAEQRAESCGGLGGWFGNGGERWQDYLDATDPKEMPYVEAIKRDVLDSGAFINGRQHQDSQCGVPLFDDGTVGTFSYRAWGDLMAAIATVKDGNDHHYMEFYC